MAARPNPGKVKVTGHGRVTVTGLRAAVRASKNVAALASGSSTSGGAAGDLGKRLKEAGVYVAGIAAGLASWSEQIPPAIKGALPNKVLNVLHYRNRSPNHKPSQGFLLTSACSRNTDQVRSPSSLFGYCCRQIQQWYNS